MKVFILALDALEYDFVEKWDLKYLKQKVYGRIELGERYNPSWGDEPYTPIVFHSFISGLPPEKHKIESVATYGRTLDFLRKLMKFIPNKRKIARILGITPKALTREHYEHKTIFDEVSPSLAIDVPTYNLEIKDWRMDWKAINKQTINTIWAAYQRRKRRILDALKNKHKWKLCMAYIRIADLLGHIYITKKTLKLMNCYLELNSLAGNIQKLLPKNSILLIMSDHGMEPSADGVTGRHSKHAFWSLNIDTDWRPKDITDFYPKIIEWTKAETTKQFQVK